MADNEKSWSADQRLVLLVTSKKNEVSLCCEAIKAQAPLFAVEIAQTGQAALDLLAKDEFDLVVMDFELPDMDGEELVTSIHDIKPRYPIIVMTESNNPELAFKVLVAGASDLLPKIGSYQNFLPRALITNMQRSMLLENLRETYKKIEQSSKDEAILNRLVIAIHSSLDLEDIVDRAAQSISDEFSASRTIICTISDNLEKIKIARQVTAPGFDLIPEKSVIFARYHDLLLDVGERIPLVVNQDDSFPFACDVHSDMITYSIKSMLMLPLIYRGKLMGFVHLDDSEDMRVWTPAQINLLSRIANQLTIAMSQARFYQIVETQSRSIDKLTELCSQLNNVVSSTRQITEKQEGQERARVKLSAREIEVLQQVAQGLSNREVAESLHITEGTTEVHVSRLRKKLSLGSRAALVRYAYENHLVS